MIPKFRAWVKPDILSNHLNGVIAEALPNFIYGNCLVLREDLEEDKQFEEIIDFLDIELMQSTGLKDKNGVEIFEGDIVKTLEVDSGVTFSTIKFEEGAFCIDYKNLGTEFEFLYFADSPLEVIGNIYENSELLEEQR
ncbi:YopX family protein [Enterococcus faecium]|uniref:YopX family protein n=1 Tax=Enterococcus faecium TaxID=1352 RepID=UPI0031CD8714